MTFRRIIRKMVPLVLMAVFVALAVVLVLGKVPVGIEYGSPYRGMPDAATNGIDIVSAARGQIGVTVAYDPAYRNIPYPNGDVPMDRGVCSDVIVRALRTARGVDLQRLVHEDMKAHFIMYPSLIRWQMLGPDPNIDHRRVLNLERFFGRSGWSLEVTNEKDCYFPGDIVTCLIGGEIPHGMIVSDRKSPDGVPLVIHNVGSGTQEEDRLFSYEITGHHRVISCVAANDVDAAAVDNCLSNVCSLVSSVVSALPDGRRGSPEYIREFGVPLMRCPSYQDLVGLVSSNQEAVCTNFSMCATNELSRMVLLASWWGGNDDLYISGLSHSLDLAIAGVVTREDLDWYRMGHFNTRRGNILALRYDEPGISNLVVRLYGFTGETNACSRILSGEARVSITNYLEEISHTR